MTKPDVNKLPREGLETAGFQRGVGSNPTPRTTFAKDLGLFFRLFRLEKSYYLTI